jgi:periplasmic protein TonB
MPHDLFNGVVNPRIAVGGRKWYTVPLSMMVHTAVIAAIVIIPLMATDSMPEVTGMMAFVAAPTAPPPPPPPPPAARPHTVSATVRPNPGAAPLETPHEISRETGVAQTFDLTADGGSETGVPGGVGIIEGGLPEAPPPAPLSAEPRHVGGDIKAPVKTRDVRPSYPAIAQSARVQGLVIIEATIGPNGKVRDVKVLRSIPLLDQAAVEAVRQWEFTPTLLNGVPVPIVMTVTVQFSLQ